MLNFGPKMRVVPGDVPAKFQHHFCQLSISSIPGLHSATSFCPPSMMSGEGAKDIPLVSMYVTFVREKSGEGEGRGLVRA